MSHWYAIQVTSGKEESTCRLMRRLVPAAVLEEVFTPRYETQKKYQGEWRMCQSILFPGYVVAVTPDASVLALLGGLVALSSPKVQADQSICCPPAEVGVGVGVLVGAGVSVMTVWKF